MISLILIMVAAIGNSMMDLLDERFESSIFKKLNPKFWSKAVSSQHAKRVFGYKIDAWHLTKSTVIILLCLAAVLYKPCTTPLIDFIIMGAAWNLPFNLFYNRIFQ